MAPRKKKDDPDAKQIQIRVTPTAKELELIKYLSKWWGRPEATIIMDAFRRVSGEMMIECDHNEQMLAEEHNNNLQSLIIRIASGEDVSDDELIDLSGEMETIEHDKEKVFQALSRIRDIIKRRNGDGCPVNV